MFQKREQSRGQRIMPSPASRRDILLHSAAIGGSLLACGIPLDRSARAEPVRIAAPTVDEIVIREITDNTHDIFLPGATRSGLTVSRTGFPAASQGKTLESEWGLALHIQSRKGAETR